MATHSSVLAWRIPGTGKPGGLLSMGLHRVGYDRSDLAAAAAAAAGMKCPHREDIFWTVGHESSETSFTKQQADKLQYILQ